MAARPLAPIFTRSYKPASAPPRFKSSGGLPWEDLSLKLEADKQHHNVRDLLPKVDQLASLPLELLLLICEHASLDVLFALSRTSKALRRLLLSRSRMTEALWELVREKQGWPVNLDKETSIVRYAHLLEGQECQACGLHPPRGINTALRVSLCEGCRTDKVQTEDEIAEEYHYVHGWAYDCSLSLQAPPCPTTGAIKISYYTPDVLLQSAHLLRVEALAERSGRDVEDAVSDYVNLRLEDVVDMNAQADLLGKQAAAVANADWADEIRRRRIYAEQKLEALGYKPDDYGDLTDGWWDITWWWPPVEREERPKRRDEEDSEKEEEDEGDSEEEEEEDELWFTEEEEEDESDDEAGEMSYRVSEYFFGDDGDDNEWDDVKLWVVTYVHRRRLIRLRAELEERRAGRFDEMRPLAVPILALLPPSLRRISPSFGDFAFLPSVQPLWYPDSTVVDPSTWSASYSIILADVLRSMRLLKLRLFSRIVRNLPSTSLSPHIAFILSTELLDADPHRAPLHHLVSDADMDPILARPTALFRCGACSVKLAYPHVVEHLRDEHGAGAAQCAAWACVPERAFREAVRALLEGGEGLGEGTTVEELRGMGGVFEVDEETVGGHVVRTLESWDELTSGRRLEDPDALYFKIDSSHDRRVVGIHLVR
ncbi:hypothetical protein JCM3775_002182 [Rhodotorula graminis]